MSYMNTDTSQTTAIADIRLALFQMGPIVMASAPGGMLADVFWQTDTLSGSVPYGIVPVTKTHTTTYCAGNMLWDNDSLRFTELCPPACVVVDATKQMVLNAVGLSSPGIAEVLSRGVLQAIDTPWVLSWASTPGSEEIADAHRFVDIMKTALPQMHTVPVLQVNLSCPNSTHTPEETMGIATKILGILSELPVCIQAKFSVASTSPDAVYALVTAGLVDAIVVSNTIPYHWMGYDNNGFGIDTATGQSMSAGQYYWGTQNSPLQHLSDTGGGISGSPLLDFVPEWIRSYRAIDTQTHITGCGGIDSPAVVDMYHASGANAIALGSVGLLQETKKVQQIVDYALTLDWNDTLFGAGGENRTPD